METYNLEKQIANKRTGFTLIEILVSLTIIGLLFGFGYVNFRDFSRRQTVNNAVKLIQGDLRLAQGNAITGQKPKPDCNLPKTLDGYSFKVISATEYQILANCGSTAVTIKDVNLTGGITISPIPAPLNFKILGQGTDVGSTDWALTLMQYGTTNTATVTVTPGGEIK